MACTPGDFQLPEDEAAQATSTAPLSRCSLKFVFPESVFMANVPGDNSPFATLNSIDSVADKHVPDQTRAAHETLPGSVEAAGSRNAHQPLGARCGGTRANTPVAK